MANPPSKFLKYAGTVFEPDILPIIPASAGAKLKEGSSVGKEMLGKIPGRWLSNIGAWIGFGGWQTYRARKIDLDIWENDWQSQTETAIAVAINTRIFHVFDIDIDKEEVAEAAEGEIIMMMGVSPVVRLRHGSSRRVLFYECDQHTPPIRKHRLAFTDKDGDQHIVEFLANGQQVVIEGPHAKGSMHYWRDGIGLIEGKDALAANLVTGKQVAACFKRLGEWLAEWGFEKVKLRLPTSSDRAAAVKIENLMSPHLAKDMNLLARCVRAIDLNDDRLADYDSWIALFVAVKAACGGDRQFFDDVVLPWQLTNPANAEEDMEAKWNSFHDSQLGAEYVCRWAATFGFSEGINKLVEEMFDGLAEDAPDAGGAQSDAVGPSGSGAGATAGAGGGGGPTPFNDTHHAIAEAFIQTHGATWRFNIDAKRWYRFENGVWRPSDAVTEVIGRMTYVLSQQILASVNGPTGASRSRALESAGCRAAVRNVLQGREVMMACEEDFDAHPHLLNTPLGTIDLRTGMMVEHDPTLLLRQMTLVSPDYSAAFEGLTHEQLCPRFFAVLRNIAAGRAWVIPAIRAWFAYTLTGELRHQALMFLYGPPGVGKSLIAQVLFDILRTYSHIIDEATLSKNGGDSKRFDMADLIGKRMGFMDETQLGMTWDETRMSKAASAKELSAELKFGRKVKFTNTTKILVVGNHKPDFVAGETGGLTSRMLLLEAGGENYRNATKQIDDLAAQIVEKEGPAILAWALEACVADYNTPALFRELMQEPSKAAAEYAKEDSLLRQWVDSELCLLPELQIETNAALDLYMAFLKKRMRVPKVLKLSTFKKDLKKAYPQIEFDYTTTRPRPGLACINGLGFPVDVNFDEVVVPFPNPNPKTQEK